MRLPYLRRFSALLAGLLLSSSSAGATSILQMNLAQLVERADLIVRGTVLEVSEVRVAAGGGELAALHYQIEVDEAFKGEVGDVKGVPIAEFKVIGTLKKLDAGEPVVPGWPELRVGEKYLLFVAPSGPTGLTATMGIGQGCFEILSSSSLPSSSISSSSSVPSSSLAADATEQGYAEEMAVNGFDNVGLFNGMAAGDLPRSGPISYGALAERIRAELHR